MLNSRKIKALIGLGVILVPSMIFAETSAEGTEKAALSSQVDEIVLGEVNIDGLNVRSYPDTEESTIIKRLPLGQQVRVIYKTNNFYKVYINGEAGFIYSHYIDIPEEIEIQENTLVGIRDLVTGECKVKVQESKIQEEVAEETKETVVSSKGDTIISTAMQYLGTPYVYGGSSLTKGTDCSGFTQGVMKLNGITIPRTSRQQSQTGKLVSKNDMEPGDLLFFGSSKSSIFHTGIYIGNGQMIHASTAKSGGVIIANAFTGGGAPLQVIRRVH